MKRFFYSCMLSAGSINVGSAEVPTDALVVTRDEFVKLEENYRLVSEAISHAFGEPAKGNNYRLEIKEVHATSADIKDFIYFPAPRENRAQLKQKAIKSTDNYSVSL